MIAALAVLCAALALLRWSDPPAVPESAAHAETPRGADLAVASGAADAAVERHEAAVADAGEPAERTDDLPAYVGRLIWENDGWPQPVTGAGEVVLGLAEKVRADSSDGAIAFTSFTLAPGSAPDPEAMRGEPRVVERGTWSMPVPENDLVLVAVRIDGRTCAVAGHRSIAAGARLGEFFVRRPVECRLTVTTDDEPFAATGLSLRSQAVIPEGAPVNIVAVPGKRPEVGAPRQAPGPGPNAGVLGDGLASPLVFDTVEYEREVWIGKQGYQWERVRLRPSDRRGEVRLAKAVRLRILLTGLSATKAEHSMVLTRNGTAMAAWTDLVRDGAYAVAGVGAGRHRLFVRRKTGGGHVTVLERELDLPPQDEVEVEVRLEPDAGPATGEIHVRITDPERLCPAKSAVWLWNTAEAGAGSTMHYLSNLEGAVHPRSSGLGHAVIPRVPAGSYSAVLTGTGEVRHVDVEPGAQATVDFDLSGFATVEVRGARCGAAGPGTLLWQAIGGSGDPWAPKALGMAKIFHFADRADESLHRFRARPGRLALCMSALGALHSDRARVVEIGPGLNVVDWDTADALGRVQVEVHDPRWSDLGSCLGAIVSALDWYGAAVVPSHVRWNTTPRLGNVGTFELRFFVPSGTKLRARASERSPLRFDDASQLLHEVHAENPVVLRAEWRGP